MQFYEWDFSWCLNFYEWHFIQLKTLKKFTPMNFLHICHIHIKLKKINFLKKNVFFHIFILSTYVHINTQHITKKILLHFNWKNEQKYYFWKKFLQKKHTHKNTQGHKINYILQTTAKLLQIFYIFKNKFLHFFLHLLNTTQHNKMHNELQIQQKLLQVFKIFLLV